MSARSLLWIGGVLAAMALLQSTLLSRLAIGGEWPDLVLVSAALIGLLFGADAGLAAGILAGLAMGGLVHFAVPAFLVSRAVAVVGAGALGRLWSRDNFLAQIAAVVLATVVAELAFALLAPGTTDIADWGRRLALRGVMNALLAPFVALLLARLPLPAEPDS